MALEEEQQKMALEMLKEVGLPETIFGRYPRDLSGGQRQRDYEKKEIVCTRTFIPTGNIDADMKVIKDYFKDFKGKYPEKFVY